MVIAAMIRAAGNGLKGGGALALDFVGAYFVFRSFLGSIDSSVRIAEFGCKLIVVVVLIALLDPLTGKLFTYEAIKGITGYRKVATRSRSMHKPRRCIDGSIRAMGPWKFDSVRVACAWLALLRLHVPRRLLGVAVAVIAFVGAFFSRSQRNGELRLAVALAVLYRGEQGWRADGRVLGTVVPAASPLYSFSGKPSRQFWLSGIIRRRLVSQAIWSRYTSVARVAVVGIGLLMTGTESAVHSSVSIDVA